MDVPSLSPSVRKGAWTGEEDILLKKCIENFGEGKWHHVPSRAGLNRCRKSCRLRWLNYLKPGIKRGDFAADEIDLIIRLHNLLGNRWSLIAGRLPGRTANDVKNYWNTHLLRKKINHVPFNKPRFSYLNPSKPNTKLVKPRPHTLIKNSYFPISSDQNNNNNNNTDAIRACNISVPADHSGNNTSYCFPNGNDEMTWLENLLMNDEEQQGNSVNNIDLISGPMNEELGSLSDKMFEEGNHGILDEIFLDVELWSVLK